jgi:multidrug efflux pump subunit AcrA (membrane-fusion protein)
MRNPHLTSSIIIACIVCCFGACTKKQADKQTGENHQSGNRIVETGELAAIDSRSFVMPRYGRHWYQMKIVGILKHGTEVKEGDSVIQLDPTEIKKYIIERESQFETQQAIFEKLQVDQHNKTQELNSRLKNEIASFNLKKLELEASQFETSKNRKIKELEFEQAKISLNKVKQLIQLNKKIAATTLRIERIKTEQLEREISSAYDILPALTIRSPISGIFQIAENRRTREMVKIGDDIFQGNNLGNVPDLSWMKVNTKVNETDYFKLVTGQKVIVRLDAMPKVTFKGEIVYLGKLCHLKDDKSRQKVFDVEVKLLKPDERLKPGMTVSCEFIENK